MAERFTTLTRKGQITIPAEFRQALGLKRGDMLAVTLEANEVRVHRRGNVVAWTAGIFKTEESIHSAAELREAAEEAIAADVMERQGG